MVSLIISVLAIICTYFFIKYKREVTYYGELETPTRLSYGLYILALIPITNVGVIIGEFIYLMVSTFDPDFDSPLKRYLNKKI